MAASRRPSPATSSQSPLRGTQLLVEHMGAVARRPSLIGIEIAWRSMAGLPILLVGSLMAHRIFSNYPLSSSGITAIDAQNPWVAAEQLAGIWAYYLPHVLAVLRWLLPAAALFWIVMAGLGRNLLLIRMERGLRFRPSAMIGLEVGSLALLVLTWWGWLRSVEWVASTHITAAGEPNLVGYAMWTIFLTLGFFTAWALASWAFSVAPLLVLLEGRSALSSLRRSVTLGWAFTGKLVEINLVMGVVEIALIVLAMVFSAAPLPFADLLGPSALHLAWLGATAFFLTANEYFQVVRLKAFVEFWKLYRGPEAAR
jgi:hypothetical protein